jgi:superfamily II DNA or RNA helicase
MGQTFSTVVLKSYLYLPKNELASLADVRDSNSIRHKYDGILYPMYHDTNRYLGIPRYSKYIQGKTFLNTTDLRVNGKGMRYKIKSSLWSGQDKIMDDFMSYMQKGVTGFILNAKPGSGKTICALHMLDLLEKKALVIVPRSNLVAQWIERIIKHSSLVRDDVGIICQNTVQVSRRNKVIIGLVHTLALNRFPSWISKEFGCVIFDEVHVSLPPRTFSPVLTMFPAKYRIGLTATMQRDDGLDKIFLAHVGEKVLTGTIPQRMPASIISIMFKGDSGKIPVWLVSRMQRRGALISLLSKNSLRNAMIVTYAMLLTKSARRTVILSDNKYQLKELKQAIIQTGFKGKLGLYIGKSSLEEKQFLEKEGDLILATYQMFDLGTDIQSLAGIVYATPHKNVEQKQGRVERYLVGKKCPVVVDIVDTCYRETVSWAKAREAFYTKAGCRVRKIVL